MPVEDPSDPSGYNTLEAFSKAEAFNWWLYQQINPWIHGEVLEIGSGTGNISTLLLKANEVVSLSDLRDEYCHMLLDKFKNESHLQKVFQLDLSPADFVDKHPTLSETFDTVIALNVIEHIETDELAIQNAVSMLKKNGTLITLVPAFPGLYNELDSELGHYKRYTKRNLNRVMASAGLEIQQSQYFNSPAIPAWWFFGKILKRKSISVSQLALYDRLVPLMRLIDKVVSPYAGISVICVGVKY